MAEKTKPASATTGAGAKKTDAKKTEVRGADSAPRSPAEVRPAQVVKISAGERARMIAEAAYFIAQNRGSGAGDDVQDWLAAERQIDSQLRARS